MPHIRFKRSRHHRRVGSARKHNCHCHCAACQSQGKAPKIDLLQREGGPYPRLQPLAQASVNYVAKHGQSYEITHPFRTSKSSKRTAKSRVRLF